MPGINFSNLSPRGLVGRLARLPLKLVPAGAKVRVLQGPMRGMKWIAGSHTHGCWLGSYERDKQALFLRHIRPGVAVYDIGANVGFYTLLASRIVGPAGSVIAFEPLPRNLALLREHIRCNELANVRVIDAAVAERAGEACFDDSLGHAEGHIAESGPIRVKVVAIDELRDAGQIPAPAAMKIDVEGAEMAALRGADRTIAAAQPVIFLATHGAAVHAECLRWLRDRGYTCSSMDSRPMETTDEVLALPAKNPAR